jgi:protein ATS1
MSEHQGDRLLALGSNGSYQLGLGHDVDVDTPTQVHLPDWETHHRIEAVASGGNHSLILRSDGAVFGTGRNAENQLGISNCATIENLCQLPVPASVKYVAAGWAFSVVVTGNGDIYTTGYGDKGELGQGHGVSMIVNRVCVVSWSNARFGIARRGRNSNSPQMLLL